MMEKGSGVQQRNMEWFDQIEISEPIWHTSGSELGTSLS